MQVGGLVVTDVIVADTFICGQSTQNKYFAVNFKLKALIDL